MSKKTIPILKSYFETGDRPTQQQFADLIDSFIHQDSGVITSGRSFNPETGLVRFDYSDGTFFEFVVPQKAPISFIEGLVDALNNKVEKITGKGLSTLDFTAELSAAITAATEHANNADIHVTTEEKATWDNKVDKIAGKGLSQVDFTPLDAEAITAATEHAQDADIHVTLENKRSWTNRIRDYESGEELTAEMGTIYRFYQNRVLRYDGVLPFVSTATPTINTAETTDWTSILSAVSVEVIDTLVSTSITAALSANQGRALKVQIDTINALLLSDTTTLDTLQEVVDFIELNRATLDSLTIASIAGLQAALDLKATLGANQTFTGQNTFNGISQFVGGLLKKHAASMATLVGYLSIGATSADNVIFSHSTKTFHFLLNNLTTTRLFTLPDKSGTLALTDDLTNIRRPEKPISNTTQYTAVLEDKDKHLVFANGITFTIPAGVFAVNDVLEFKNEGAADLTVVEGAGLGTIQVVSSQSKKVPQFGFGGLRFRNASTAGLYGQLKPI